MSFPGRKEPYRRLQFTPLGGGTGGGGGGGGAPTDATYITASSNGTLSAEVVFGTSVFYPPNTLASRPAAGSTIPGAIYFATDGGGVAGQGILYRSDGVSVWEPIAIDKDYADVLYQAIGAAAGGDLSGNYPNPSVNDDSHNHGIGTLSGVQPSDATLSALAAFNTNGLLTQTAADTFTGRTITSGALLGVTDGNGVAGNPTVAVTDVEILALGGLTSAADQVPFFTGSGTASLFSASSLGRATAGLTRDFFSNADKTVTAGTGTLAQTGTMSAARTVTLPAANTYAAGTQLVIVDESGTVTRSFTITVTRAGADTISAGTTHVIGVAYGFVILESDGTSKWTVIDQPTYVDVQEFTATGAGTWTKPANAVFIIPHLVGAGGSGGSGRLGAAASDRYGGGGGGAGGVVDAILAASLAGASETVTVGTGGTGVAGVTGPTAANGTIGNAGGSTTFGSIIFAGGGGGGGAGQSANGLAGTGAAETDRVGGQSNTLNLLTLTAPPGGASALTAATLVNLGIPGKNRLPGGGGAGGGIPVANTEINGGQGGATEPGSLAGGTGGAVNGGNGAQGTAVSIISYQYGPGGGGGGSQDTNTLASGSGAAGRTPGGGGGGSGAGTSGNAAGSTASSGAGGNGYAIIFTLCGRSV